MDRLALFVLLFVGCGGSSASSILDSAPNTTPTGADAAVDAQASPSDAGAPLDSGTGTTDVAIEIVQATTTQTIANVDPSITFNAVPRTGNAIIVAMTCFSDIDNCSVPPGGVTDNQNNTYLRVVEGSSIISQPTHGSRGYIFIAESIGTPTGNLTVTVNPNGSPTTNFQTFAWGLIEVAGLVTSNSVDRTGTTAAACCNPSTAVTTAQPTTLANELAVAVHSARTNTPGDPSFGYVSQAGWTQHHVNNDPANAASQHSMVTSILTQTGSASHSWQHDAPTRGTSAIIATFKGRRQ
jgi:hypothetical protein